MPYPAATSTVPSPSSVAVGQARMSDMVPAAVHEVLVNTKLYVVAAAGAVTLRGFA